MNRGNGLANWAFFDRIYCITLRDRTDRRSRAHRQFSRLGIASRVRYMVVERHPTDSEQGIYDAHMRCLREGIQTGARRMVIFEDDVAFERFDPRTFNAGIAFLEHHPEWTLLFLGCLVTGSHATESTAIRAIDYRCLAHAYAINRPCALQVLEKPWRKIPFDVMLRGLNHTAYAVCPMIAFQNDATTDNHRHCVLDRIRRWCGGLRRIQKVNEWYHRHRWVVVALHVAGLALALMAWRLLRGGAHGA
jgi:GR25 family glycosyltransferase involved in LPS biosynthesis